MQVPSAAVTTESHALSRYKSFQSVLFFEYLINQLLPQRVFQQHLMDASGANEGGQILGSARVFPAPIFLLEEDFSRELHGAGVVGEVELLLVELRGGNIDEVTRACSCG